MTNTKELSALIDRTFTTKSSTLKDNTPEYIIIHSTQKNPNFESLHELHTKVYQWNGVGYHIFISNSEAYKAREYYHEGAHCLGMNFKSIGICVYARKNRPSKLDLDIAKTIINNIQSQYGPLPVMSHTLAQIIYINKLSLKKEIALDIYTNQELNSPKEFLSIKDKFDKIIQTPALEKYPYLKSVMKNFKDCPGEGFYDFIREINSND